MNTTATKSRRWQHLAALAVLTAATGACVAESETAADEEVVGASDEELVGTDLVITRDSLVFDACTASLSLRFQTSSSLSFIALDATLASNLALELVTFGADGLISPLGNVIATPIDAALLGSVRARLASTALSAGILLDTVFLSTTQLDMIATMLDASTQADLMFLVGSPTLNATLLLPAMQLVLNPAVTGSTLLLTGLGGFATTSIGVRARFAADAFALSRVNVLAATSAGLFQSRAFDVSFLGTSCLGLFPSPIFPPFFPPVIPPIIIPPIILPPLPPFPPSPPTACGDSFCGLGEFCCNPSCGICAPLGGVCIQIACE